jgi:hypothetical protein
VSEELHTRIRNFLAEQLGLAEGRQCVKFHLLYSQPGFRDEDLRRWERDNNPEWWFGSESIIAQVTSTIIETAETHADSCAQGSHRYVVRTYQHLGGRAQLHFMLGTPPSEASHSGDLDAALRLIRQIAFAEADRHKASNEIAAQDEWEKVLEATRLVDQLVTRARAASKVTTKERT